MDYKSKIKHIIHGCVEKNIIYKLENTLHLKALENTSQYR